MIYTEENKSATAKKVAKQRVGTSVFSYYKQLGNDIKMISKRPKGNPQETGDWEILHDWLLDEVNNCNKVDRLEYLQKDAYVSIYSLEKLAKNMADVKAGHPSRFVDVRYINKIMSKGNSPAKTRKHINWMKSTYLPAIKKRKAELKKANNESSIEFI